MLKEVQSAVDFLSNLLAGKPDMEASTVEQFRQTLNIVLRSHYEDHWFPEKPFKGSAYRCMRICNQKMDPLMAKAGAQCGLSEPKLLTVLPSELTIWVDPQEVSYRIGEEGSIGVLYDMSTDIDSSSSSDDSMDSVDSYPSQSNSPVQFSPHAPAYQHPEFSPYFQTQDLENVLQSCKDELRYSPYMFYPGVQNFNNHNDVLSNLEYMSTYVAS